MKYFLYSILFFVLFSCNNPKKIEDCNTCKPLQGQNAILKFNFSKNKSLYDSTSLKYWCVNPDNKRDYCIASASANEKFFQGVLPYINSKVEIADKKDLLAVVLYVNKDMASLVNLTEENIQGFSLYKKAHGNAVMQHILYQKQQNNVFKQNDTKSFKHKYVTSNDLNEILNDERIFDKSVKSYIIISGEERKSYHTIMMAQDNFSYSKISPSIIQKEQINPISNRGGGTCPSPCSTITQSPYCMGDANSSEFGCTTYKPGSGGCGRNQIEAASLAEPRFLAKDKSSNFSLMYDFRDNFMMKYTLGQTYIVRYYELSEFLDGKINTNIALKTLEVLGKFDECMNMLLNADQNQSKFLVDNTLKMDLLNLLDDYKALSSDTNYVNMLESIKTDVNLYANKTVAEVITLLN